MPENPSETYARRVLVRRLGLTVNKIAEDPPRKTPDFEVSVERQLLFVAEVKNLTEHETPAFVVPGTPLSALPQLGPLRNDNGAERISRRIVGAAKQLKGYGVPRALIFVNDEPLISFREDFRPGFDGCERIGAAWDGSPEFGWVAPRGLLRELRHARASIDLYVWIERNEDDDGRDLWFASTSTAGWRIGQHFFRDHVVRRRAA